MSDRVAVARLDDGRRLAALRRGALLDGPPSVAFDRLTRLATTILHAPVALVTLVEAERQFFMSCVGLPEPWASARQTPLSHSFCQYPVITGAPLIIADARTDPVLRENLAIPDLGVVAYAGIPLVTSDGYTLGSFCVIDHQPRAWTDEEVALLTDLAAAVMTEIELRALVEEHAQVEQRIIAERDRLGQALDLLPEAVIVTDETLTILVSNRAAHAILGADAMGPAAHLDVGQAIPTDDAEALAAYGARHLDGTPYRAAELPLERAVLQGEEVHGEQVLLRNAATGRDVPVLVNAAPLCGADGQVIGGVVVFQDISTLKGLERERDEFFSSISHDLKTPLTSIRGYAQLAQRRLARLEGVDTTPALESIAAIETATARMLTLVNDLLEVTRGHLEGAAPLDRRPTDLAALARRLVAELHVPPTHRVVVEGLDTCAAAVDPDRIERVLGNLLSNAIKYSPRGGTVTVQIAREDGDAGPWAVVRVRDEGLGIAAADLARIFERFQRGSNVTGRIEGTGVGLASARQIVAQHGGTITVDSVEGQGATFTVRLPVGPAGEVAQA